MTGIKWIFALLAVGLLLAGCGGDDGESADEEAAAAPEALEGEAAAEALGEAATKTATVEEGVDATLDLAVTGTGPSDSTLGLDALFNPATNTGEIGVETESGSFTVRLGEDESIWLTSDEAAFTDALPEGAEWVELTPEELTGLGLDTSFDAGGLSPQVYLVLGATDVVAGDGSEINGAPVQDYSFSIDKDAAVAAAPEESKEQVEGAITLEGDNQSIEGEAAIDGEGYLRQFSVTGSAEALSATVEVTFDIEYLDFGVDVPEEAPATDTVVPLSEAPDAGTALQSALAG